MSRSGNREVLQPPGWAEPRGYANGVAAEGRLVFVAGQIGWNARGEFATDDFVGQVEQALDNVVAVLREAGAGPEHLVRMTWYVTDKARLPLARGARSARPTAVSSAATIPAMTLVVVAGCSRTAPWSRSRRRPSFPPEPADPARALRTCWHAVGSPIGMWHAARRLMLAGLLVANSAAALQAVPRRNAVFSVEVTAYCDVGETASGAETRRGIVAADPTVLPLGSQVRVQGLGAKYDGTYDVEDTGREVKGRELDIFMRDCRAAKTFGRKIARLRILRVGTGERISKRGPSATNPGGR